MRIRFAIGWARPSTDRSAGDKAWRREVTREMRRSRQRGSKTARAGMGCVSTRDKQRRIRNVNQCEIASSPGHGRISQTEAFESQARGTPPLGNQPWARASQPALGQTQSTLATTVQNQHGQTRQVHRWHITQDLTIEKPRDLSGAICHENYRLEL